MNAREAFAFCREVTRARASNFFYGIRLLPGPKRDAMCAIYAFARRVDDVADGDLLAASRLEGLEGAQCSLDRITAASADPVLAALGHAGVRFELPLDALADLIDGAEMDVRGSDYASFAELERYCRRVAGSIGRLSVSVFGSSDPKRAAALADDLGVAMQLTNILRDLREDRDRGRVYLPREDLVRFSCWPDPVAAPPRAAAALIRFEAGRARGWFARGLSLLPLLDRRSAACVSAMAGIYLRVLGRVARRPEEAMARRVSLGSWEKAWVAASSLATGRPVELPRGSVAIGAGTPGATARAQLAGGRLP